MWPLHPGWRRSVGLLSLLVAAGLTLATAFLLMSPNGTPQPVQTLPPDTTEISVTLMPTAEIEIDAVIGHQQHRDVVRRDAAILQVDVGGERKPGDGIDLAAREHRLAHREADA